MGRFAASFSKNRNRSIVEPVINLTPLIDVVFVILIMFIVIAPLLELDKVELAEGPSSVGASTIAAQETSPISIHVKSDDSIWFNNQRVTASELPELLREAKARYPNATPQLFHDRYARFGTYQSVKNAAEAAGFQNLEIILKPA